MGWTEEEYLSCSHEFIDEIVRYRNNIIKKHNRRIG